MVNALKGAAVSMVKALAMFMVKVLAGFALVGIYVVLIKVIGGFVATHILKVNSPGNILYFMSIVIVAFVLAIPTMIVAYRSGSIASKGDEDVVTHYEGQAFGSHVSLRPVTRGETRGKLLFLLIWIGGSWYALTDLDKMTLYWAQVISQISGN